MQTDTLEERPFQRVKSFLENYFKGSAIIDGHKLPSTRKIAAQLGVSEATVRNVVRKFQLSGKVNAVHGSGIFVATPPKRNGAIQIGINFGVVNASTFFDHRTWGLRILTEAFEAALEMGPKLSLLSMFSSTEYDEQIGEKEIEKRCAKFDGLILYQNGGHYKQIIRHCQAVQKPFVCLNAPANDTNVNFVAPEYFTATLKLAEGLRRCGRKRLAVLIYPSTNYSWSIRQRLGGMINGLGVELNNPVAVRIADCADSHAESGRVALQKLLEEGYHPDGVICAGDALALGAIQALDQQGLSIPDDVSVIAGAGIDALAAERQITSIVQPTREMGRQLVDMIYRAVEGKSFVIPAQHLPFSFRRGRTTTAEESQFLSNAFISDPDHKN